jgi:hypothetical protein
LGLVFYDHSKELKPIADEKTVMIKTKTALLSKILQNYTEIWLQ